MVQLAEDGEIRQEYESELQKFHQEREEENMASELLIQKILKDEEAQQCTKLRKSRDRHAFKAANKENKPRGRKEQRKPPPLVVPRSDSVDSIGPELRHFKPIARFPRTPPHQSSEGKMPSAIKVPPGPRTVKKISFPSPPPPLIDAESCSSPINLCCTTDPMMPAAAVSRASDTILPMQSGFSFSTSNSQSPVDRFTSGHDSDTISFHSTNSGYSHCVATPPNTYPIAQSNAQIEGEDNSSYSQPSTGTSYQPITSPVHKKLRLSRYGKMENGNCEVTSRKEVHSALTTSTRKAVSTDTGVKKSSSAPVLGIGVNSLSSNPDLKSDEEVARYWQHIFNLEMKHNIDSSRLKGGSNEYAFRKRKRKV